MERKVHYVDVGDWSNRKFMDYLDSSRGLPVGTTRREYVKGMIWTMALALAVWSAIFVPLILK